MRRTPRHVGILIERVEVQSGKALKTTAGKIAGNAEFCLDVARMNYLAADRPDVMFAVTEGVGEEDGLPLPVRE